MAAISVPMCRATSNAFSIALVVEVVPAEQPRHEQQVAARRDRQELGQALHEAEDDGVQDRHRAFLSARRACCPPLPSITVRRPHRAAATIAATTVAAVLLTACGGDGDDGAPAMDVADIEASYGEIVRSKGTVLGVSAQGQMVREGGAGAWCVVDVDGAEGDCWPVDQRVEPGTVQWSPDGSMVAFDGRIDRMSGFDSDVGQAGATAGRRASGSSRCARHADRSARIATTAQSISGCAVRRQAPLIVTSRITRLTPAARIGSQSTSPPTSTMSSSIRCSVEAIVNSRTGAPTSPLRDQQPGGAGREVAADRVDAGVEALHALDEQRRRRRRRSSSAWSRVPGQQLQRQAADARRAGEPAADRVAGRHRAGPAGRVAGVHELAAARRRRSARCGAPRAPRRRRRSRCRRAGWSGRRRA